MPPKRGKKAAPAAPVTPPLDGCKIAISGTFSGTTHASIKAKAEALGATVASTVAIDTTHLVATEIDFNKPSPKVVKARPLGIPIVALEWLLLCEQNNAREPEKDYIPGSSAKDATAQTDAAKPASSQNDVTAPRASRTRKRASPQAADNTSDNEAAPKAKRTRGRAAAAVKTEDDVDLPDVKPAEPEEEAKSKVKTERAVGEGQVAKRKDVQIPVDEGCPYVSSKVYIDDAGVIYDASLNQTNASNNNNKFYRLQVCFEVHILA
jgi:poly [ADP-ribose] polymerase